MLVTYMQRNGRETKAKAVPSTRFTYKPKCLNQHIGRTAIYLVYILVLDGTMFKFRLLATNFECVGIVNISPFIKNHKNNAALMGK